MFKSWPPAQQLPLEPFFCEERQGRGQEDQDQQGIGVDAGQHPAHFMEHGMSVCPSEYNIQ